MLGARIGDRFVVLGLRAFGATAAVYDALDDATDERAVLKVVRADVASDVLAREAAILGALSLDAVPRLRARVRFELPPPSDPALRGGVADVLAMDVARGRAFALPAVPSSASARRLAESALTVLASLHDAGVAHGDLKPGHLFVDEEGALVGLVDFGSATASFAPEPVSRTPAYAPEDDGPGPRFDLYSLATLVRRVGAVEPPRRGCVDPALARFVERGLAAAPGDRLADAREALTILAESA